VLCCLTSLPRLTVRQIQHTCMPTNVHQHRTEIQFIPQEYRYGRAPTRRHRHILSKTAIESYLSSHRNAVATCCSPPPCQQAESYPNPPRASHQSRTNVITEPPRQCLRTTRTSTSSAASHAKHCYERIQLILDIHGRFRQLSAIANSRQPSQRSSSR
jgi:hypothetical protein